MFQNSLETNPNDPVFNMQLSIEAMEIYMISQKGFVELEMNRPLGLQTDHREEQHSCMKEEGQRGWYGSHGGEN